MAKVTLNDITTEFRGQAQINNNFTAIEDEFQNKVLYRNNPFGEPNSMQVDLDMNGFNILNVGNVDQLDLDPEFFEVFTERKVASASQTTVNLSSSYSPGTNGLAVYVNGVRMSPGIDFVETSSTSVTFTNPLSLNDELLFVIGREVPLTFSGANTSFKQDGNGTIFRSMQNKMSEFLSVKDFGAIGDGSTTDTAAIQAAFDAAEDRVLFFPKGTYRCGEVTISKQVRVIGEGPDATYIKANRPAINIFNITTTARVDIENMTFSPSVANTKQTAAAYVKYGPTSGYNFGSRIRNCVFSYSWRGIHFEKASAWSIEDCYFAWYRYGVDVANTDTPDAGDSTIRANVFDAGDTTGAAIRQLSSGGLRIINNKILNGDYGYVGEFNSSPSMTSILLIQGNSIEWPATAGIGLNSTSSTTFGMVLIEGNQLSVPASGIGVILSDPGYDYLDSVNISDNLFNLGNSSVGVNLARGARITLLPNTFYGNGTNETAVTIGGNVDSVVFYPQVALDCTNGLTGVLTNVIFYAGLSQSGSVSATASASYGSLYTTALQNVAFPLAFPVVPKVQATVNSKTGGGLSASVYDVSAGGFNIVMFGITSGGVVNANWFATL